MGTDAAGNWLASLKAAALDRTPLLVAYSGGLDSTVLLHALAGEEALRSRLRAVHVDHGLHPTSPDWAQHCRKQCEQWQIELDVRAVTVDATGHGPEAAARIARYDAFEAALHEGETLVLAHHRDDQAETVLLRLLRGAGSRGLAAMAEQRAFAGARLWRPLLAVPREALRRYAEMHALTWLEDPSNADSRFDRNFLRQQVLPLLQQRWPQAQQALAHSARWLADDAALLDEVATRHLAQVQGLDPDTLSAPALRALPERWQSRVLHLWLAERGRPHLPTGALETLLGEVLGARPDAVPEFRWAGEVLRRWQGLLWLEHDMPDWPCDWSCRFTGDQPVALPDGRRFRLLREVDDASAFTVRARHGGERLQLPGRVHHSELKTVLQDLGVPPWQRTRLPLLFDAGGALLAAGEWLRSQSMTARGWHWQPCPTPPLAAH